MRTFRLVSSLVFFACAALPAAAQSIDFDELPAANDPDQILGEEYADMGVHFSGFDDAATWSGMSGGDPGAWQVEGSNGPAFLGFDGPSYMAQIDFDVPVQGLALDVARGSGASSPYDSVRVTGFLGGVQVEVLTVYLGGVNAWQTAAMTEEVDRIDVSGVGERGYRFALDNLSWSSDGGETGGGDDGSAMLVDIDIKPFSERNRIWLGRRGVLPVALFGDELFDVEDVDPSSLAFGPGAAGLVPRYGMHRFDVDRDGHPDLLLFHRIEQAELGMDDAEACLVGATWSGEPFEGCDRVTPMQPTNNRRCSEHRGAHRQHSHHRHHH